MKYIFLFMSIFSFALFQAQERILKADSATGGRLVIDADRQIMTIIDDNEICKSVSARAAAAKSGASRPSPANLCQKQNTIRGFMIKVGDAKTEQEINTMTDALRSQFPDLRIEKNYMRPDWRLLAGDFMTQQSAQADLKKVRKVFPTAVLVNWRIYCNRAK